MELPARVGVGVERGSVRDDPRMGTFAMRIKESCPPPGGDTRRLECQRGMSPRDLLAQSTG